MRRWFRCCGRRRRDRLDLPAAIDQPKRTADQEAGHDILAEFIDERRRREVEIIGTAGKPHHEFADADHARDMEGREHDDCGRGERKAQRPCGRVAHPVDASEQHRRDQDDGRDARHFPQQRCAEVVGAAAPGRILRGGERVHDSNRQRDYRDRQIEPPVGTGYPAQPTAGPRRLRLIPRRSVLIPNRLDAGSIRRIFDVSHHIPSAFGDRAMQQQTISQSPDFTRTAERRVDLDWVRIAAFGLLIFYHVGMLYVSWGFHIKSAHRITALEPLLRSRSVRLMIPLVFGMLVVVPPQAYEQIVEALGYPAGFVDFYQRHYLAFGPQFCPNPCIVMPTWNHLWFVVYLWVYTAALGGALAWVPGLVEWVERKLASALSGALLLVVPTLVFASCRLVLFPNFPSTHALFGDWYNHAQFATVFLLGFLLAR